MKNIVCLSLIIILFLSCQGYSQTFCAVGYYGEFTQIDPQIGEVGIKRTDLPKQLQAMSWSPNGILYAGTNSGQIYSINPLNGDYTLAYTLPVNDLRSMAFSSDGLLYLSLGSSYLKIANLSSGEVSTIGTTTIPNTSSSDLQGLAFSPEGILYGITPNIYLGTYSLYTIDPANAGVHLMGKFTSTANINQSLTFTPDGRLYAVGNNVFAQINPINGAIIGQPVTVYGNYRGLEVLPEPLSCFYLALGAFYMMKKRNS